jgi:hypothetical protein
VASRQGHGGIAVVLDTRALVRAPLRAPRPSVTLGRTVSLLGILIVSFVVVVLAVVALRFIGSRRPKPDPGAAEAIAMAEADRRSEAARRPTGGTGMWQ